MALCASWDVFTEEIKKIALSSNGGKRMQSIDSIETYVYVYKNVVRKKEGITCNNIIIWVKQNNVLLTLSLHN